VFRFQPDKKPRGCANSSLAANRSPTSHLPPHPTSAAMFRPRRYCYAPGKRRVDGQPKYQSHATFLLKSSPKTP
jgi:hypothetical protein